MNQAKLAWAVSHLKKKEAPCTMTPTLVAAVVFVLNKHAHGLKMFDSRIRTSAKGFGKRSCPIPSVT